MDTSKKKNENASPQAFERLEVARQVLSREKPKGMSQRQFALKVLGIGDETSAGQLYGNWKNRGVPMEQLIPLGERLEVHGFSFEWVARGTGPMRDPSFPAPEPQPVAAPVHLPGSVVTRPQPKHVWNFDAPSEKAGTEKLVHIPLFDIQGSQGNGREVPDHEIVASQISVSELWLRRNLAFSAPGNLSIIAGVGDSMKPTFSDGDLLLVDRGVSEIRMDAVYVLELHNKLYIKRLQIRPDGAILMLSDNKAYEPYLIQEADMESVHVRARVLMAWNANKL